MTISFHLNFAGRCQEAFEFYSKHLGGTIGTMLRFKNSAISAETESEWQDKVVHANITIKNIELAGADVRPEEYKNQMGFIFCSL